ncbi:hypothetical protein Q1W73_05825 [Asticcacaulis sp. ZE23SCel15]|uniref:hypothetical protein n=1 Tax=Asticcacaulis sp. ZE23SCel15 TaxID=3059027 RepID=UPI00265EFB34|nr:hypothetical protein [Asticcacaulis sp. ZE23SCel15]WKL58503.1 hypothetical protein Q1W73_05825 [Asticcacaulis sp. ZE23SCel15]
MDLFMLSELIGFAKSDILEIEGRLFIDHDNLGLEAFRNKIAEHASVAEAQYWMNILLLKSYIDNIVGDDWEFTDERAKSILKSLQSAWTFQINAKYPNAIFRIDTFIDEEANDFGLWLRQD